MKPENSNHQASNFGKAWDEFKKFNSLRLKQLQEEAKLEFLMEKTTAIEGQKP